jgi:filamentous hemagglutinin
VNPNQPSNNLNKLCGAGGTWRVIEEIIDSAVIIQKDEFSCGPACAQMLFRDRGIEVSQAAIATRS